MPPSPWSGPVRSVPLVLPLVLLVGLEAPSRADRFSIGASLGSSESEGGTGSLTSRSVFARVRVVGGLSLEGEVGGASIDADARGVQSDCLDCGISGPTTRFRGKLATATARFDLISRGAARPHILVGGGVESWSTEYVDFVYGKRGSASGSTSGSPTGSTSAPTSAPARAS